jgi:hypothetical protein
VKNSKVLCLKLCYLHPIIPIKSILNDEITAYMVYTNFYEAHLIRSCGISKRLLNK